MAELSLFDKVSEAAAAIKKILPVPPSHVLLLFLGMTAAPDAVTLAILMLNERFGP